jgi:Ca2+/Na+ antiporter
MRKWLFFLAILALVYIISRINRTKQGRSPFFKRLNETFSIIAWVLLTVYILLFLYWLYTRIFR